MTLLITAGIVATGLGAFIAGLVVAALSGCVLLQGARVRRRAKRLAPGRPGEPRARTPVPAPRWASAWRRWALEGVSVPGLWTRTTTRRAAGRVFPAGDAMHRSS